MLQIFSESYFICTPSICLRLFARYVILLAGNATVTFPERPTETLSIKAGDMLIAADILDTSTLGHETVWQGGSVALQVPFNPGFIPDHDTSPGSC